MPSYINYISTRVPRNRYEQSFIRDFLKKHVAKDRLTSLAIHQLYSQSAIDSRYSVISDFSETSEDDKYYFRDPITDSLVSPTTGIRNELYEEHARELFCKVTENAISTFSSITRESITHVITVSCTGFYAPGPDFDVVMHNRLNSDVQRLHIGFMGCYAAFPALRMAHAICNSNPDAVVLIAAVELCTLHLKFQTDTDSMISTSVFADGAAAVIVSGRKNSQYGLNIELGGFRSLIAPNSTNDMAWTIGDFGFDMKLSTYVPDVIASNINDVIKPVQESVESDIKAFEWWAVHPGGRAILDKIQKETGINDDKLSASRNVLRDFGNMSSVTILFVLDQIRRQGKPDDRILAMAFGPGLTIESGVMQLID